VAQAGRDLDVHENVLRKWVKEFGADPAHAFPGHGQMKPEQQESERLRREVTRLKAERDILKKAAAAHIKSRLESNAFRKPASSAGIWSNLLQCIFVTEMMPLQQLTVAQNHRARRVPSYE
jgi:transposase